jgi:uncharacterized protein (DUF1697 family)
LTRYAAFIRAIGPETHKVMPQSDLCAKCDELGLMDTQSFIASGNLYFSSRTSANQCSRIVEKAIASFGLERPVFTRSVEEIDHIIACNPFPDAPTLGPMALSVSLFDTDFEKENVQVLLDYQGPERIKVLPRLVYVHFTQGQARSKINGPAIERKLKAIGTARNINTLIRIRALLDDF